MAGDKHLQEKGITKIICPAAGSASMTQWSKAGVKDLSIFRFAAHDGIQAAMVVEEAINRKLTKVAIFHDSTNYGVSGRDDMLNQIKKQGNKLEVVAQEKFNIGDKDMTAQLLKAKAAGAQAILIWGIGPELAAVVQRHGQDRHEGAAHRRLDALHVQLHRQRRQERQRHPHAADLHRRAHHAEGQGLHRRLPQGLQGGPHPLAGVRRPGLRRGAHLRRRREAGRHAPTRARSSEALEDLKEPVKGVIATWKKPYTKWDPADVTTHEAFRREQVVMGMVQDGRVVFGNDGRPGPPDQERRPAK